MDRFSEMIKIEKEFGACLDVLEPKKEDESLWMHIFKSVTGSD
jgi:hypothetical protein